jgi:hypothetical protein
MSGLIAEGTADTQAKGVDQSDVCTDDGFTVGELHYLDAHFLRGEWGSSDRETCNQNKRAQ